MGAHPHLPQDRCEPGTRGGDSSSHQWTRQPPPPSRHSWMNLMHSLKCCSLQGERQGGGDGRAARPCKAPGHTTSRVPHQGLPTALGPPAWGGSSDPSSAQRRQRGLIFICQEGNDLGDFPRDFLLPRNQEQGDAISQTSSGRTPGRQPPGKVSSCAQGTGTSPSQRLS